MATKKQKKKTKAKAKRFTSHEDEHANPPPEEILRQRVKEFVDEAEQSGVHFSIGHEVATGLYVVSVKGERGQVRCTLQRLPAIVHGLFVMGIKVREIFWQMHNR